MSFTLDNLNMDGGMLFDYSPAATVVTSGLLVYFDAGLTASYPGTGATWFDLSGNGYNATLYNSPTYDAVTDGGILTFNGSNQYAGYTITSGFTAAMTVITIAKSTNVNWSNNGGLGSARSQNGFIMHCNQNAKSLDMYWYNSSGSIVFPQNTYTASNIQIQTMYTGTNAGSGNEQILYANTTVQNTTTNTANRTNTGSAQSVELAKDQGFSRYTAMSISAHLVYNRVLSSSEITQNWNYFKTRYGQ